jgi:hypothetical protein
MIGRRILCAIVIGVAIAAPYYLTTSPSLSSTAAKDWFGSTLQTHREPLPRLSTTPVPPPGQVPLSPGVAATDGPQIRNLSDVFRMDVTPSWIMQQWPRVSRQMTDAELYGLRVTLVSGTSLHDLAGVLTYHFDRHHMAQRISFEGTTGDPRQLIALVTHYGFRPEPIAGGYLCTIRDGETLVGALHVRHATTIQSSEPRRSYRVQLEVSRPGGGHGLDPAFVESLSAQQ